MSQRKIIAILFCVILLTGCFPQPGIETTRSETLKSPSTLTTKITNASVSTPTPITAPTKIETPTKIALSPTVSMVKVTVTPTPTAHPLQAKLPKECLYEHAEFSVEFYQDTYTYDAQACKAPALSPDQLWLSYVTFDRISDPDGKESALEVVKLINLADKRVVKIYQPQNFTISNLDWSSNGKLVVLDASTEYVGSSTIIIDVGEMQIIQDVSGYFWTDSWNEQRTAFFTRDRDSTYGPHCKDFVSGYDFASNRLLPSERLIVGHDEIIRILQGPYWIEDGQAFIFSARKSIADAELEEKTYGPSMVLKVELELEGPRMLIMKSDPEIDYVLNFQENGTFDITEEPYLPLSCWDIYIQETGGGF